MVIDILLDIVKIWGKAFQAEGTACAKALRQDQGDRCGWSLRKGHSMTLERRKGARSWRFSWVVVRRASS